jgi:hypothetical protein
LVRELAASLSETPISQRAGHLKGSSVAKPRDGWVAFEKAKLALKNC